MVSITLDFSLLIQIINFLVLLLVMNHFLYRPIRKILDERKELFDRLKDKAAKAKAEIENGEAEKARLNAESIRQALAVKNEFMAKSQAEEKNILAEANEQASRQINDGRAKLAQSLSSARESLNREVENIAREMAEKILGRGL